MYSQIAKICSRQRVYLVIFLLFSSFVVENTNAVEVDKREFIKVVRSRMMLAQGDGLWSQYFNLGDTDSFLNTVEGWVNGIAIDPAYLVLVEAGGGGYTQFKGWSGYARVPFRAEESRYIGYIILHGLEAGNQQQATTAYHEAIHAYSFAVNAGKLHLDEYSGPEFISNQFISEIIAKLRKEEIKLDAIFKKIAQCKDAQIELNSWLTNMNTQEDIYIRHHFKGSNIRELLKLMGGRMDWAAYEKAIMDKAATIAEESSCKEGQNLEAMIDALERQVTAFKQLVDDTNIKIDTVQADLPSVLAARKNYAGAYNSIITFPPEIDLLLGQAWELKEDFFGKSPNTAENHDQLLQQRKSKLDKLSSAYQQLVRATQHASQLKIQVCADSRATSTNTLEKNRKQVDISAASVKVALTGIEASRLNIALAGNSLQELITKAKRGSAIFNKLATWNENTYQPYIRSGYAEKLNAAEQALLDEIQKLQLKTPNPESLVPLVIRKREEISGKILQLKASKGISIDEASQLDQLKESLWSVEIRLQHLNLPPGWDRLPASVIELEAMGGIAIERNPDLVKFTVFENSQTTANKFTGLYTRSEPFVGKNLELKVNQTSKDAGLEATAADSALDLANHCINSSDPQFASGSMTVPNVIGVHITNAVETITDAGFTPQPELGSVATDPGKVDTIESQSPAIAVKNEDVFLQIWVAATTCSPTETLNTTTNECERQKAVLPALEGVTYDEAVRLIKLAGLVPLPPVLGKPAATPEEEGLIEFALPAVDGQLHIGDEIIPYLYGEAIEVGSVPNVTGLELSEAAEVITQAGFDPAFELGKETSDSLMDGIIYNQAPAPGVFVEPGSVVTLMVYSLATATTPIPNLKGLSQERARQVLKNVGLFVNVNKGKQAHAIPDEGKVYRQYPQAGFEVMDGIGIDIWIYDKAAIAATDPDHVLTGKPNWDNGCAFENNTGGAILRWKLRDPPPYSGLSPICSDRNGVMWIAGNRIVRVDKGDFTSNGCYRNSSVVAENRTYRGKICSVDTPKNGVMITVPGSDTYEVLDECAGLLGTTSCN